jgi:dihydrofolate reductase
MQKVIGDISISLDGFVTGPDPGPDAGLGRGGEPLHRWAIDSTDPVDRTILRESTEQTGAVVMGRRLFDVVDGVNGWSSEMGFGADEVGTPPFFVVTHAAPERVRLDLSFTFVLEGLAAAIAQAKAAAGERHVIVMGGAEVVRAALAAGYLDELRLHIAPLVLGAGTPLFDTLTGRELLQREVQVSPHALHVTYAT